MKPLCVVMDNMGARAASRLVTVLRDLSARIGDPSMKEDRIRGMRRFDGAALDEGAGVQWTSGRYRAHVYAWATPVELEISVTTPGRKPVRLRMPMPRDARILEDERLLSSHIARLADMIEEGVPIHDERAERLIERLDGLAHAAAAVASTLMEGRFLQTVRIQAPSPFEAGRSDFAHHHGRILTTTSEFRRLVAARLPIMMQIGRNNTRDLHFALDAMGCFVEAKRRSTGELLRQVTPFGPNPLPMVEWSSAQRA